MHRHPNHVARDKHANRPTRIIGPPIIRADLPAKNRPVRLRAQLPDRKRPRPHGATVAARPRRRAIELLLRSTRMSVLQAVGFGATAGQSERVLAGSSAPTAVIPADTICAWFLLNRSLGMRVAPREPLGWLRQSRCSEVPHAVHSPCSRLYGRPVTAPHDATFHRTDIADRDDRV